MPRPASLAAHKTTTEILDNRATSGLGPRWRLAMDATHNVPCSVCGVPPKTPCTTKPGHVDRVWAYAAALRREKYPLNSDTHAHFWRQIDEDDFNSQSVAINCGLLRLATGADGVPDWVPTKALRDAASSTASTPAAAAPSDDPRFTLCICPGCGWTGPKRPAEEDEDEIARDSDCDECGYEVHSAPWRLPSVAELVAGTLTGGRWEFSPGKFIPALLRAMQGATAPAAKAVATPAEPEPEPEPDDCLYCRWGGIEKYGPHLAAGGHIRVEALTENSLAIRTSHQYGGNIFYVTTAEAAAVRDSLTVELGYTARPMVYPAEVQLAEVLHALGGPRPDSTPYQQAQDLVARAQAAEHEVKQWRAGVSATGHRPGSINPDDADILRCEAPDDARILLNVDGYPLRATEVIVHRCVLADEAKNTPCLEQYIEGACGKDMSDVRAAAEANAVAIKRLWECINERTLEVEEAVSATRAGIVTFIEANLKGGGE